MNVLFIASVAVVAADPPESRKLFIDTIGLPLERQGIRVVRKWNSRRSQAEPASPTRKIDTSAPSNFVLPPPVYGTTS